MQVDAFTGLKVTGLRLFPQASEGTCPSSMRQPFIVTDPMKTLLLWDIDGTLILSAGAGERALVAALRDVFGIAGTLEGVEIAGRTDRWIARSVFKKFNLPATPENLARYLEGYLAALPVELARKPGQVLPGIEKILETTDRHSDIANGLLTGNLQRGAELKLSHYGLWSHFAFGAFADDAEMRDELGPHAVRRACAHHDVEFATHRVWVIGDTPHDIACGKAIGANTVGVATGRYGIAELQDCGPTAVFADLSKVEAFFELLDQ